MTSPRQETPAWDHYIVRYGTGSSDESEPEECKWIAKAERRKAKRKEREVRREIRKAERQCAKAEKKAWRKKERARKRERKARKEERRRKREEKELRRAAKMEKKARMGQDEETCRAADNSERDGLGGMDECSLPDNRISLMVNGNESSVEHAHL